MSQSPGPPPPDEPIIGGPPPTPTPPYFPAGQLPGPVSPVPEQEFEDGPYADDEYDDEWDDGYDDEADEYDEYYYDEGRPPTRQPVFYLFLALAALIGAIVVFFIFVVVRDNGGDTPQPTPIPEFSVLIDTPQDNARVEVDSEQTFQIRAKSTQSLDTVALIVDGKEAASKDVSTEPEPKDGIYAVSLKTSFAEKREYTVLVRVTTIHGAEHDSKPITVVAYEPVNSGPPTADGKVVATVGARTGPGDAFSVVRTLQAGDNVTIVGKSSDGQWLVISGGSAEQQWVRAAAIQASGSLDKIPVVDTPASPTPTPTQGPPTATPTTADALPDFVPGNATLIQNGGVLEITVANIGQAPYSGPLAIAIDGVTGSQVRVFNVNMAANGGMAINFALNTNVTGGGQVTITVDPDGAIHETREDNNSTSFTVQGPVIEPTATPEPPSPTSAPSAVETPPASETEPEEGGSPSATEEQASARETANPLARATTVTP